MKLFDIFKKEKPKQIISTIPTFSTKLRAINNIEAFKHWSGISINARAEAVGKTEPIIYKNEEIIYDSWLNELIDSPNDNMRWSDLMELASQWLDVDGNVYLYMPESGIYKGKPIYIDILPSDRVRAKIGTKGIEGYQFTDGVTIDIKKEDIIHIKTLAPNKNYIYSNLIGTPRIINTISTAILTETEKHEYLQEHYSRRAISPYVLIQNEDYEDAENIYEYLRERVPENYKPVAMFPHGYSLDVIKSDTSNQNAVAGSGNIDLINEICAAYGTPKSLLTMEFNARATAEVAEISFYQKTISPILTRIYNAINSKLKSYDDLYIWYELPDYDDTQTKVDNTIKLLNAGIIDIEQAQSELGYEKEEPMKMYKLKTYSNHYWNKWERIRTKSDEELEKDIIGAMKRLQQVVTSSLERGEYVNLFDINEWKEALGEYTFDSRYQLAINSITESLNDINFSYVDIPTEYDEELNSIIKESANKISETINTLDTELKKDITEILLEKPINLEQSLLSVTSGVFNQYYTQGRAKMIARTTSTLISEGSKDRVWTKYGYSKMWLSERDSKVRDSHRKADGQVAVNGLFRVGGETLRYPAGGSKAENNINCRCVLFPVGI